MNNSLKRTPLYDLHVSSGARIVEFGGWEMPVQYKGLVAEHNAVRSQVGMFDVSHMGQIRLVGTEAASALETLIPMDVLGLVIQRATNRPFDEVSRTRTSSSR